MLRTMTFKARLLLAFLAAALMTPSCQNRHSEPSIRGVEAIIGDFPWPETRDRYTEAGIDDTYTEIRISGELYHESLLSGHGRWNGFTYCLFVKKDARGLIKNPKSTGDNFGIPMGYVWISKEGDRIKVDLHSAEYASERGSSPIGLKKFPFNGEYVLKKSGTIKQ